ETDAFEKYNKTVSLYDFPVYTSTGNHDVGYGEFLDRWTSLVNVDAYHEPVREGVCDVAENGLDFVYAPEKLGGDVFLFLSQIDWSYNSPDSRLLADEQLDWLASELEKYKDRRVYLFFHTFMADDNGDPRLGEGNLLNDKGVTYDLVYTVGTEDETRFRALLQEYKNVIFFNGHSHWEFEGVSMNPIMNITDYGGSYATFVHVPSVSSPRRTYMGATNVFEQYMRSSQGYLVKVYEDKIVLFGTQFWGERFLAFATFNIYG
ncbi:MAG: metallophosphoesterase, partial [Clostridia bacterium]|nr:metallophosphoesterase [Clostridia bacterium]